MWSHRSSHILRLTVTCDARRKFPERQGDSINAARARRQTTSSRTHHAGESTLLQVCCMTLACSSETKKSGENGREWGGLKTDGPDGVFGLFGFGTGAMLLGWREGMDGACEGSTAALDTSVSAERVLEYRTSPPTSSASSRSAVVCPPRGPFAWKHTLIASQSCSSSQVLKQAKLQ